MAEATTDVRSPKCEINECHENPSSADSQRLGEMGEGEKLCQEDDVLTDQDPDYTEERFRIDRRKLEQLLQATEDDKKNAEQFFVEIMQDTGAIIVWPSKLKIGAKSKKDPLIKVCGSKNAVLCAKEKIMNELDTKSTRVTLKMEVSHTEHSHVIGKGGSNIQRVMRETDCHIHFPDSNRSNLGEKSNQVSITGQCQSVEMARTKIRSLLPLVVLFELPASPLPSASLDSSASATIQQVQQRFGVSVVIKQHLQQSQGFFQTVIVRGSVCNAKAVEDAAVVLFETLTGRAGTALSVTLLMDIAPLHHLTIIGYDGSNIKQIIRRTGATIYFPDASSSADSTRSTLYITGPIPNVFLARQELMGWLPVVLMFDVKDEREVDTSQILPIMKQLDVFISLKPKAKQPVKSVIVKTTERNISSLYEARTLILSLLCDQLPSAIIDATNAPKPSTVATVIPEARTSPSATYQQLPCTSNATVSRSPLISPNFIHPYVSASPGFQPLIILPPVHSYHHMSKSYSPAIRLPCAGEHIQAMKTHVPMNLTLVPCKASVFEPNTTALQMTGTDQYVNNNLTTSVSWSDGLSSVDIPLSTGQIHLSLSSSAIDSLNFDAAHSRRLPGAMPYPEAASFFNGNLKDGGIGNENAFDVSTMLSVDNNSLLELCLQNSLPYADSNDRILPPPPVSTPDVLKNHRSLSLFNNTQNDLSMFCCSVQDQKSEPGGAGFCKTDMDEALNFSRSRLSPPPAPSASQRFGQLPSPNQKDQMDDMEDKLFIQGCQVAAPYELHTREISDPSKAPGRGRPKKSICSSILNHDNTNWDYEEMKLSANRAMQQKPMGDSRIPTAYWSGLYFSKSMPESTLFDKMNQNVYRFRGMPMSTMNEDGDAEAEDELWKGGLDSYNSPTPIACTLDTFNCTSPPDGHSFEGANNLSDITTPVNHQYPAEQQSGHEKMSTCSEDFSNDPLSKLSEIWQPKVEENNHPPPSDLAELFSKLGLGKYTDLFQQQEIDMTTFLTLTEADLRELGISTFGARRKMLLAIEDHNKQRRLIPPPPGLPNPFRDPSIQRFHDAGSQSGRW